MLTKVTPREKLELYSNLVRLSIMAKRKHITELRSVFQSLRRQSKKMNRVTKHRIVSDGGHERLLFPSPITPAYVKNNGHQQKGNLCGREDVEDACRSFENYLVEMIVEEGKVRDLMDVEELLYCWKNLKCPIFIDLVCRFYGELCKDLFSPEEDEVGVSR
ncbi:hypothetical protein RJ641_008907 [Dillenia turbinata]|uniref:OVATE domain-containing protein n=1 Tax=Dillenia turbinata TaxID=194707 RepID=A0AAN8V2C1_9MAGN